ncbi:MAG: hypothetical protein NW224_12575 [Leptolyngbyaceae cyanobacterium bins.302]|nr:hypothetical protein [Leptolyngbyaceae cyanobacterium bins.302]
MTVISLVVARVIAIIEENKLQVSTQNAPETALMLGFFLPLSSRLNFVKGKGLKSPRQNADHPKTDGVGQAIENRHIPLNQIVGLLNNWEFWHRLEE